MQRDGYTYESESTTPADFLVRRGIRDRQGQARRARSTVSRCAVEQQNKYPAQLRDNFKLAIAAAEAGYSSFPPRHTLSAGDRAIVTITKNEHM
jgi:hypothetical protein